MQDTSQKIVTDFRSLKLRVNALRAFHVSSPRVGLLCGTFHLFHEGHKTFIDGAAQKCDLLIALVNSDQRVKRKKGNSRPIHPQQKRSDDVANDNNIGVVFSPTRQTTPIFNRASLILIGITLQIKPDIIFYGSDFNFPTIARLCKASGHLPALIKIDDGAGKPHTSDILKNAKS